MCVPEFVYVWGVFVPVYAVCVSCVCVCLCVCAHTEPNDSTQNGYGGGYWYAWAVDRISIRPVCA